MRASKKIRPDRGTMRRRGRLVVELAIVISVLLLMLLGIFEYGRLIMMRQLMDDAAREGARLAVVSTNTYPPTTVAQIQSTVNSYLGGQTLNNVNIQVYQADPSTGNPIAGAWYNADFGAVIAVQVDADYPPIFPATLGIVPNPLHLTSKSMMRSEAN